MGQLTADSLAGWIDAHVRPAEVRVSHLYEPTRLYVPSRVHASARPTTVRSLRRRYCRPVPRPAWPRRVRTSAIVVLVFRSRRRARRSRRCGSRPAAVSQALHVPLIVAAAGASARRHAAIDCAAGLGDVAPTLLRLDRRGRHTASTVSVPGCCVDVRAPSPITSCPAKNDVSALHFGWSDSVRHRRAAYHYILAPRPGALRRKPPTPWSGQNLAASSDDGRGIVRRAWIRLPPSRALAAGRPRSNGLTSRSGPRAATRRRRPPAATSLRSSADPKDQISDYETAAAGATLSAEGPNREVLDLLPRCSPRIAMLDGTNCWREPHPGGTKRASD